MALAATFPRDLVIALAGTVLVHLVPGDPTFETELQRAPDSGGSPGTWKTIARLPATPATVFSDKVVLDDVPRWYRARHVRDGWTVGAWKQASAAVTPSPARSIPQRAKGDTLVEIPYTPIIARGVPLTDGKFGGLAVNADGARFRAVLRNSADQSISNDSVTTLTWDTEEVDNGALHSTSSNTGRITIPTGGNVGLWILVACVEWAADADGYREIAIQRNNPSGIPSKFNVAECRGPTAGAGQTSQQCIAVIDAPAVGTYFEVEVRHTAGAALNVVGDTVSGRRGSYFHAVHVV